MRRFIAVAVGLWLCAFAPGVINAQTAVPVEPPRAPTQYITPAPPILPPGLSSGDRDLIMALIAERDRQYDQRFRAQETAMAAALAAADKAIAAAFAAADKATVAAFAAAKEAVEKAERANDKHFEAVNEFRKTLTDQTATFAPRAEIEVRFRAIEEKIASVSQRITQSEARLEGASNLSTYQIAIGGFILGAAIFVFAIFSRRREDGDLSRRRAR
jgi:hypothetical protein